MRLLHFFQVLIPLSALIVASPALAQDPRDAARDVEATRTEAPSVGAREAPDGVTFGVRTAYALAGGDIAKSAQNGAPIAMSTLYSGLASVSFDIGYRFASSWYIGGSFQYGVGTAADRCNACSLTNLRWGIAAQYHVLPGGSFDPWLGVGAGYEVTNLSQGGIDASLKGFDLLAIQIGGDARIARHFNIGPYAGWSVGEYRSMSGSLPLLNGDIQNPGMHQWVSLGLKGTFNL